MFKKMGKPMLLLIALALTLCVATVAAAEPQTFTGEADGFGGPVKVEVTVDDGRISDVTVVEQNETQGVGTNAIDQLPGRIVETQSIGLDAVAGCTVSSRALLSAVENALSDAGLDMDALKAPPASGTQGEDETLDTDVVVVGAGIAGLSAAITAKQNGADVVLLEKMSFTGGNSKLSTGVFQFGGTDVQAAAGIEDTPEAFYEFAMEKSGNKRDPVQVRLVAEHGKEDINWLKSIGVEIADEVSPVTGSAVERGHQGLPNAPGMMDKMTEVAEELGVDLHLNTAADALLTDESGRIVGVTAVTADGSKLTVNAKNTILAAGGFAADPEKLKKYWGLDNVGYAGVPGTTGEMMEACLALGADTMDIDQPWLTPTVEITTNTLMTAMMLSKGAFLVTSDGKRFCDEEASYKEASDAVLATGEEYVYEIFDEHVKEAVYKVPDYIAMGVVTQADTLEELAEKTGLPYEQLAATVEDYNSVVRGEKEDEYGRTILHMPCDQAPYYCVLVKPGTVMSPGGLKVNEKFEIVKTDGTTLEGVYAVGEMTGGYRAYGYIGGDSMAHALVSGRIAANEATR